MEWNLRAFCKLLNFGGYRYYVTLAKLWYTIYIDILLYIFTVDLGVQFGSVKASEVRRYHLPSVVHCCRLDGGFAVHYTTAYIYDCTIEKSKRRYSTSGNCHEHMPLNQHFINARYVMSQYCKDVSVMLFHCCVASFTIKRF